MTLFGRSWGAIQCTHEDPHEITAEKLQLKIGPLLHFHDILWSVESRPWYLRVPLPQYRLFEFFERLYEHREFLFWHLTRLECGAERHVHHSPRGRVHELLEVCGERFGVPDMQASHFDEVRRVGPGAVSERVTGAEEDGQPLPDYFLGISHSEGQFNCAVSALGCEIKRILARFTRLAVPNCQYNIEKFVPILTLKLT